MLNALKKGPSQIGREGAGPRYSGSTGSSESASFISGKLQSRRSLLSGGIRSNRSSRCTIMLLFFLFFMLACSLFRRASDLSPGDSQPRPCYVTRAGEGVSGGGDCQPVVLPPLTMPRCALEIFQREMDALDKSWSVEGPQKTGPAATYNSVIDAESRAAGIEHVFVIHYTPDDVRYKSFMELLKHHRLQAEFITSFDREVITPEIDNCFFAAKPNEDAAFGKTRAYKPGTMYSPARRSIALKHLFAIYLAHARNYAHAIVFEDDIALHAGFRDGVREALRTLPPAWDMVSIGGCLNDHGYRIGSGAVRLTRHLFHKNTANCLHAALISRKGMRTLLSSIPLCSPVDLHYSHVLSGDAAPCSVHAGDHKQQAQDGDGGYWFEPWLALQAELSETTCNRQADFGASCPPAEGGYTLPAFNLAHVDNPAVRQTWQNVPWIRF